MTSILRVSNPTRDEALPIFEDNIVIMLNHEDQFMWIQRICRQAKTMITTWMLTSRTIGHDIYQRDLSDKLPALQRVECHVRWRHPITCSSIDAVIENLNGSTAGTLTEILENEIKSKGVSWKKFPCDLWVCMSFDLLYELDGWSGAKVSWKTRLQLDVRKQRVVERSIWLAPRRENYIVTSDHVDNLDSKSIFGWAPANEVLFIHEYLQYPVLYHLPTGRKSFVLDYPTQGIDRGAAIAEMEKMEAGGAYWRERFVKAVSCDSPTVEQKSIHVAGAGIEVNPEEYWQ